MRRALTAGAPWLLCAAGLLAAFWPMWSSHFALMPGDPADARLVNYLLEHGHRFLTAPNSEPLWSPLFFFPQQNVAAYSEVLLGAVPLYGALRGLGLAPDSAFQGWVLVVGALNYLCAWLLFRRGLEFDAGPAALGALVFAFAGSRVGMLNHPQLWPVFFSAVAVHGLVHWLKGGRRPVLALTVAATAAVLQLWTSVYLGWFLCFGVLLVGAWALALPATRAPLLARARRDWKPLVAVTAGAALALVPLARAYLGAAQEVGARTFQDSWPMVPQAQSWLYVGPRSAFYGWMASWPTFAQLPVEGEHRIGLGLVTTAVLVVVLVRERRRAWVRALALATLTLVLCATLYRGRVSPWEGVMAVVPGAAGLRAVARIGLLLLFPAGFAVASVAQRYGRLLGLGLAGLCAVEQLQRSGPAYGKESARADVATLAALVPRSCVAFFSAPSGLAYDEKTQVDAMWAAQVTGVPTVNGYSGATPPGWELGRHTLLDETDEPRLRAALGRWEAAHGFKPGAVCWVEP